MTRRKPPIAEADELRPPPHRETDDQKVDRVKRRVEAAAVVLESEVFRSAGDKVTTRGEAAVASSIVDGLYPLAPTIEHGKSAQKGRTLGGLGRAEGYKRRDALIEDWVKARLRSAQGESASRIAGRICRREIPEAINTCQLNGDEQVAKLLGKLTLDRLRKIVGRVLSKQK